MRTDDIELDSEEAAPARQRRNGKRLFADEAFAAVRAIYKQYSKLTALVAFDPSDTQKQKVLSTLQQRYEELERVYCSKSVPTEIPTE